LAALAFARESARVLVTDIDEAGGEETLANCATPAGRDYREPLGQPGRLREFHG
jgi:hypothetical protein